MDALNIIQTQLNEATSNEFKKKREDLSYYVQETSQEATNLIMRSLEHDKDDLDREVVDCCENPEYRNKLNDLVVLLRVYRNEPHVIRHHEGSCVWTILKSKHQDFRYDEIVSDVDTQGDYVVELRLNMRQLISDGGIDYEKLKKELPLKIQKIGMSSSMRCFNIDKEKYKEYFNEIRNKKNGSESAKRERQYLAGKRKGAADVRRNTKKDEWERGREERKHAYLKKQKEYDDEYEAEQAKNEQEYQNQSWLKRMFSKPKQAHHKQADRKSYKFE